MKRNILKDLEDAQADREESMRDRERIHTDNSSFLERRQFSTMRMRAEEYRREIEELRDCFNIQMDQAKENAADCSKGCDELYDKMVAAINTAYKNCKENNDHQVDAHQQLEQVKLERDKHQLMNLVLEQEVESQIDQQICQRQKLQKQRKMNARTIKKTQTYLVELEATLREKQVKVQS